MQFFVTFNCSFLVTPDRGVGIWYVEDGDGKCVEWPADLDDSIVKGAQSALTISTIAGFMAGILVLFEWVCCEVCCAGCLEGLAFCTSWVIGSSVFMIYGECIQVYWKEKSILRRGLYSHFIYSFFSFLPLPAPNLII